MVNQSQLRRVYGVTKEELMLAVWLHTVQCHNRLLGCLTAQGMIELNESIMVFRRAEIAGQNIPSMQQAIDYYNFTDC